MCDEIQVKICKGECPSCGADGVNDICWGEKVFADDVVYEEGSCNKCKQVFREFWDYCETEWIPMKKKPLKDYYPDGQCPDCGEDIPDDISSGTACTNCEHVFYFPRKND